MSEKPRPRIIVEWADQDLTPEQAQELRQELAREQLISPEAALELIQTYRDTTRGHARRLYEDVLASREVDHHKHDNGFVWAVSKHDLVNWLHRNHPMPLPGPPARARRDGDQQPQPRGGEQTEKKHSYRFPGDEQLVEEGRGLVRNGVTKSEAARRLAPRAEGKQSLGQKESRLRRLF
jgi:hypothetical protein